MVCVWGVGQPNLAPYKNPAPDLGSIARAGDTQAVLRFGEFIVIYSSPIVAVSTLGCEGVATWGGGGAQFSGRTSTARRQKARTINFKGAVPSVSLCNSPLNQGARKTQQTVLRQHHLSTHDSPPFKNAPTHNCTFTHKQENNSNAKECHKPHNRYTPPRNPAKRLPFDNLNTHDI